MMLKAVLRNWKRWQGLLRGQGGIVGAMVFGGTLTLGSLSLAGDLLRGGATFGSTPAVTPGAATSPAQAQARANAADLLSKTTQALKAVQAMQAAAQNAAASASNAGANPNAPGQTLPNVPNGLVPGGLQVAPGATSGSALWSGANLPTQSGNAVTVKQNSSQALLHWQTFNVGQNTKLFFDQSAGGAQASQWIAFNMVNDPSGVPSQILGSIQAAGQVYVINQNGIIFGGASQVNVHTLVASSLPINTSLISNGLLNNPDAQFLFSALPQAAGTFGPTPAFTPPAPPNTANGELGAVTVQAGATITSPASAANVGGRVALIGPNVTNNGTINTPDGQTILAAGLQVGFAAHATSDASLRGLDVYVGAISDTSHPAQGSYAGTVTNNGIININEASVVMAGKTVNQNGIISGASSVSLNGRIDLLAQYNATSNVAYDNDSSVVPFFFASTGAVNLGTGSVTQILPDLSSTSTIVPTMTNGVNSLALSSEVNLQGLTVHLASGSILWAPGGAVNVNAGQYQLVGGVETFVTTAGQIYLDAGAMINTAGEVDVSTPLSDVIDQVQLRGPQLQDQALQRNGALRGQTITVDLRNSGMFNGVSWVGTPLADLSGYAGTVQYSATQLSINGGAVKLNAGGSVVVQNGATVNVSGGWANYPSGMVQTTRLLTMNGQLVDIAQATPDMVYQGVYTGQFTTSHPAWGIALSQTFTVPWMTGARNEAAYSAGGNGGSIYISAPTVALDGSFLGSTITGPRQQSQAPSSSSFTLNLAGQAVQNQALLNQFSPV